MSTELQTSKSNNISVGTVTTWPNYWPRTWDQWTPYNTYVYSVSPRVEHEYANEIEVERHEHDATLRFYRIRKSSKSLVKEVTIPLGLLDWLQSDA